MVRNHFLKSVNLGWRAAVVFAILLSFAAFPRNADYSLQFILRPSRTLGGLAEAGGSFKAIVQADSSAAGFSFALDNGLTRVPLSILHEFFDGQSWQFDLAVPSDAKPDTYDLVLSFSGGTDREHKAVRIFPSFPETFYFVQLSDTQPYLPEHLTMLKKMIETINLINPAFVVLSGDVVEFGTEKEWQSILPVLSELKVPLFLVPGNHDIFWVDCCRREMYHDRWRKFAGPLQYSFSLGPLFVAAVEISGYEGTDPEVTASCPFGIGVAITACPYADLEPDQISWLESALATAAQPLKIVVGHQVEDDPEDHHPNLEDLLIKYGAVAYLYGHLHKDGYAFRNGIHWILTTTAHEGRGRVIKIENGHLSSWNYADGFRSTPLAGTVSVNFSGDNNGTKEAESAIITNTLNQTFEQAKLRFYLREAAKPVVVSGGQLASRWQKEGKTVVDVLVELPALSSKTVTVRYADFTANVVSESTRNPVVLVHGYTGSILGDVSVSLYWSYIKEYLERRGLVVDTVTLGNAALQDIRISAQELAEKVQQVLSSTGAQKVDLVGHSEGTLVSRAYVKYLGGDAFVDDLVSLAGPHRGTVLTEIGPGTAARQMEVGSDFLKELNNPDPVPGAVRYTSIFSLDDSIVVPGLNGYHHGALNMALSGVWHGGVLFDQKTAEWIAAVLTADWSKDFRPITIEDGSLYTRKEKVLLHLRDMNPLKPDIFSANSVRISEDINFKDASWQPMQEQLSYSFTDGEGLKAIYVQYKDASGDQSPVFTAQVLLDQTPPEGTVKINDGSSTTSSPEVTLEISGYDNSERYGKFTGFNALYAYGLDRVGVRYMRVSNDPTFTGAVWQPFKERMSWKLSDGDGKKTVYVQLKDEAGNVSVPFSATITLDSEAPSLTITSPEDGYATRLNSVQVMGRTEASAIVRVNGEAVSVAGDGSFAREVFLVEGQNAITVEASDKTGNTRRETITVLYDTQPPVLSNMEPEDGSTSSATNITVSGSCEGGVSVYVNAGDAFFDEGLFTATVTLQESENNIVVACEDDAGNRVEQTLKVYVDTVPPELTVSFPPDQLVTSHPQITITGTVEAGSSVRINGESVTVTAEGNFSSTLVLTEGNNALTIQAFDRAGNTTTETRTVIYSDAPELSLLEPAQDLVTNSEQLKVSGKTGETAVAVSVNGQEVPLVGGSFSTLVNLAEGENTVAVEVRDNQEKKTIVERKVTLDTVPPELSVDYPVDGQVINSLTVTVSGRSEKGAIVEINGTSVATDDEGYFARQIALTKSDPKVVVKARDKAGNQRRVSLALIYDNEPPNLSLFNISDFMSTQLDSILLEGRAEGADSVSVNGYTVNLDADGSFSYSLSLREGLQDISVVATDQAGNTTTRIFQVMRDTQPPFLESLEIVERGMDRLVVQWVTSEPTTSEFSWGSTREYEFGTVKDSALKTVHKIFLEKLTEGKTYHFAVSGQDAAGNTYGSGDFAATTLTTVRKQLNAGIHLFTPFFEPVKQSPPDLLQQSPEALRGNLAIWNAVLDQYDVFDGVSEPGTPLAKLEAGKSYWIKLDSSLEIQYEAFPLSQDSRHSFPLNKGWNMIGSVFQKEVPVTSLIFERKGEERTFRSAVAAGWIVKYLWTFNSSRGSFELIHPDLDAALKTLSPDTGYFLYALVDDLNLLLSPEVKEGPQKQRSSERAVPMVATLSVDGKEKRVFFGRGTDETIPFPPKFSRSGLELYLLRYGQPLAVDLREQEVEPYKLVLENNSPGKVMGTLAFRGAGSYVIEELGRNLKGEFVLPIQLDPGQKKTFTLFPTNLPVQLMSAVNFPNPVSHETTFDLKFSAPVPAPDIQLSIYSSTGKRIATLYPQDGLKARHQIKWKLGQNGLNLPNGVYFYIIEFNGKGRKDRITRKLVVLR